MPRLRGTAHAQRPGAPGPALTGCETAAAPRRAPVAALLACLLWCCADHPAIAEICPEQPANPAVTAYCGITAPEDMVRLDPHRLIIGSMAPADHLHGFDMETQALSRLETRLAPPAGEQRWGEPGCTPPGSLIAHGLDLSRRVGGERQLLVVNHDERESVEFFSLEAGTAMPVLQWRGCVLAKDNAQFNDVAGLPDGGFLATDPITASWQLPRMLLGSLGMETGQVYRWRPVSGYEAVPNTSGAYPNGILLSADGTSFYLNLYLDDEVREHALQDGTVLNRVRVQKPDNSSLSPQGKLLVASHDAGVFAMLAAVLGAPDQRNSIPYAIVEIDPDSFESSLRYRSGGEELGGGTIAEAAGDDLYIGAFRGDRFVRVRIPAAP